MRVPAPRAERGRHRRELRLARLAFAEGAFHRGAYRLVERRIVYRAVARVRIAPRLVDADHVEPVDGVADRPQPAAAVFEELPEVRPGVQLASLLLDEVAVRPHLREVRPVLLVLAVAVVDVVPGEAGDRLHRGGDRLERDGLPRRDGHDLRRKRDVRRSGALHQSLADRHHVVRATRVGGVPVHSPVVPRLRELVLDHRHTAASPRYALACSSPLTWS